MPKRRKVTAKATIKKPTKKDVAMLASEAKEVAVKGTLIEPSEESYRIVRRNGAPLKFFGKKISETLEFITDEKEEIAGSITLRIYKSDSGVFIGEIAIESDGETYRTAGYEYSLKELANFFMDTEDEQLINGAVDLFEQTKLDWDDYI